MKLVVDCFTGASLGVCLWAIVVMVALLTMSCTRAPTAELVHADPIHGICTHPGLQGGTPFVIDEKAVFEAGVLTYPTPIGSVTLTGAACIYQGGSR